METIVKTKEELKKAKQRGDSIILVKGQLAKDLLEARKITKFSQRALAFLTAGIITGVSTAPITHGLSLAVMSVPITTITGLSVPTIILISFLGVGFILAIFKDYSVEIDTSSNSLKLIKK